MPGPTEHRMERKSSNGRYRHNALSKIRACQRFDVDRGLAVAKSFGRKYVEFATPSNPVKLALYGRRALAKDAGVSLGDLLAGC